MGERELLLRKLEDGIALSQKRPWFLGFLSEEELAECEDALKWRADVRYLAYGGYEQAQRKLLGLFPEYADPDPAEFPLTPITFTYRTADTLTHRDFLGSFMALGVERSVIGDIVPGSGSCTAFLRSEMVDYFTQNLHKIGRVGVKITVGLEQELTVTQEFETLTGVVASERLDCIVAFLCHTGRTKAAELITAGMVAKNHREVLSVSERLSEGDTLSVRKYGKFLIDRLGPKTAKGRLAIACRKYK